MDDWHQGGYEFSQTLAQVCIVSELVLDNKVAT